MEVENWYNYLRLVKAEAETYKQINISRNT